MPRDDRLPTAQPGALRDRWFYGLLIAFGIMVLVNVIFIYLAVSTQEPISASYLEAGR